MAKLTDAQLDQIAQCIFVMGDRAKTKLPKPTMTAGATMKQGLDWIASDPDFGKLGIGVIDFTDDARHPTVWINNGDRPNRIGSASKIAMMLAAVQLRLDVRRILAL